MSSSPSTLYIVLCIIATLPILGSYSITDAFIDIEIYARGHIDEQEPLMYIKVNDIIVSISRRGMIVVVLDEVNGSIIDSVNAYDDGTINNYLYQIETNKIVAIASDEFSNVQSVISILNTWGCAQITNISNRKAFIFIGTKNWETISNFTYCAISEGNDSVIHKTFQISLYSLYRMIPTKAAYICADLMDAVSVIHNTDYTNCTQTCLYTYNNECVMINYIWKSKTSSDSRCYIFKQLCDIIEDTNGNVIAIKGFNDIDCIDFPLHWTDSHGDTCFEYRKYNWCYDASINDHVHISSFMHLADTTYELNAIQSCCVCGGGLYVFDDITLEFTVSIDGNEISSFNKYNLLCDWDSRNGYIDVLWDNIRVFDLCTKLAQSIDHHFVFVSDRNGTYNYNLMNHCDIFIYSSVSTKDEIIVCDFSTFDVYDTNATYFIAIFDVGVNETSTMYLNSDWIDRSEFVFSKVQTYEQCVSSLSLSLKATIYGILPCDIISSAITAFNHSDNPSINPTISPKTNTLLTVMEYAEITTNTEMIFDEKPVEQQHRKTISGFVVMSMCTGLLCAIIFVAVHNMCRNRANNARTTTTTSVQEYDPYDIQHQYQHECEVYTVYSKRAVVSKTDSVDRVEPQQSSDDNAVLRLSVEESDNMENGSLDSVIHAYEMGTMRLDHIMDISETSDYR